jgi:hypothetical protein
MNLKNTKILLSKKKGRIYIYGLVKARYRSGFYSAYRHFLSYVRREHTFNKKRTVDRYAKKSFNPYFFTLKEKPAKRKKKTFIQHKKYHFYARRIASKKRRLLRRKTTFYRFHYNRYKKYRLKYLLFLVVIKHSFKTRLWSKKKFLSNQTKRSFNQLQKLSVFFLLISLFIFLPKNNITKNVYFIRKKNKMRPLYAARSIIKKLNLPFALTNKKFKRFKTKKFFYRMKFFLKGKKAIIKISTIYKKFLQTSVNNLQSVKNQFFKEKLWRHETLYSYIQFHKPISIYAYQHILLFEISARVLLLRAGFIPYTALSWLFFRYGIVFRNNLSIDNPNDIIGLFETVKISGNIATKLKFLAGHIATINYISFLSDAQTIDGLMWNKNWLFIATHKSQFSTEILVVLPFQTSVIMSIFKHFTRSIVPHSYTPSHFQYFRSLNLYSFYKLRLFEYLSLYTRPF